MNSMLKIGILLSLSDMASAGLAQFGNSLEQQAKKGETAFKRLGTAMQQHSTKMIAMGTGASAFGYGLANVLEKPIEAFTRLDDATTDLEVTMMDSTGKIGEGFKEILELATSLGNKLPGETSDFVRVAQALMEQGMAAKAVKDGGLEAASYLSVVLKQSGYEAATMVAKLKEAYQMSDKELGYAADQVQRARFAFGMKPEDIAAANSYQSAQLNVLGIKGAENLRKMLALQGEGAQVGLEGSSFGTNFSMLLTRLAKGPLMMEEAKKGMKAQSQDILKQLGITFDFFNKAGNFKGLDALVVELEKFKTIKDKLGDKAALEVSEAMFGAEAARPALTIAQRGVKGYQENLERMERQADLSQRIDKITSSWSNTLGALTGTFGNIMAELARPALEWLKPVLVDLNSGASKLGVWVEKHRELLKWGGLFLGGLALTASVLGGIGLVGGLALRGLAMALAPAAFLMKALGLAARLLGGAFSFLIGPAMAAGRVLMGVLSVGIRAVGTALMMAGRALMANPLIAIGVAIGVAAYLVWKHWATIKKTFMDGYNFLKGMGQLFYAAGANLINGLIDGISSKLAAAKAKILEIGASIKAAFTSALDIHSPSRVFAGYGENITKGLALGMDRGAATPERSAGSLAGRIATAGRGGSGGGHIVHFSPNIHVQGGGDVKSQVQEALRLSQVEFERLYVRMTQQHERRALA